MQIGNVTTPFGRRSISLALVKGQLAATDAKAGKSAEKWKVFRDVSEARSVLGLQDRALAVLDALLSFYPESHLSEEFGLVVFPSNAQLSIRAHGITGTTLRRQLAALVDAGLIHRRDSPNGKRYAHRGRDGEIEQAFGFSLAPLLARVEELAQLAQQVAEERRLFKRAKEALTICRRDVRKLITAAMEEGADGDWEAIEGMYVAALSRLPRNPNHKEVLSTLDEMTLLRDEVVNLLEIQQKEQNKDGNGSQNGCHIQNSKPESINEFEPSSEKELGEKWVEEPRRIAEPKKPFPLSMVLRACPEIVMYGQGGMIGSWRELMTAAVVVRSSLGVSPSAYQDACDVMGPENAATAIACILERAGHINSAGGYLRDLTRKAARDEFGLGPMLMPLLKANTGGNRKSA
ncbi:plasmid replication protein RepC [Rhizobium sp. AB2/73]|uniref:plasmid replication protein RepC n=1 Tax=Rhizobium sp. AB2/73 TaxID=2795216 RepID=UPI000DE17BC5|nr:plasmid replication protein RepC [Rhizobium sp. AB2/73]QYA17427.1 replication initiation protein RepC [Rhizobium sp. AB2/73]UEQ85747.1 replication initiation protein RepC [Rhizobium sp. AB2/73]